MGRYNNTVNSNINFLDVHNSTGMGTTMSAYRGKSGINSTGEVSFSDLRGVYTSTPGQSGYGILDNGNSPLNLNQFHTTTPFNTGQIDTIWHLRSASTVYDSFYSLNYVYNTNAGIYNWAATIPLDRFSLVGQPSFRMVMAGATMNADYTLTVGQLGNGQECALAMGMIHYRSQSDLSTNPYTFTDLWDAYPFNIVIGNRYINVSYFTNEEYRVNFRSASRTLLTGIWFTSTQMYAGILYTSPFQTGAALSSPISQLVYNFSSLSGYHKNNQIHFGLGYSFTDVASSSNYASFGLSGYYVLGFYDVGYRNALYGNGINRIPKTPTQFGGQFENNYNGGTDVDAFNN